MKKLISAANIRNRSGAVLFFVTALVIGHSNTVSAGSMLVTDLVNGSGLLPVAGVQSWGGQLGDDFTVNSDISISSIGAFDSNGDGTAGSLFWQLFNVRTGALIHSQEIVSTGRKVTGTSIFDNYVWAEPSSAINLLAGETYSAVAYGFDNIDRNFNTNFNLRTLDVVFDSAYLTGHGGRYSGSGADTLPTAGAGYTASDRPYNFGAATFQYEANVPEPSTLLLMALGLMGLALQKKRLSDKYQPVAVH